MPSRFSDSPFLFRVLLTQLSGLTGTLGPGRNSVVQAMTPGLLRAVDLGLLLVPSGTEPPEGLPPVVFDHRYARVLPLTGPGAADRQSRPPCGSPEHGVSPLNAAGRPPDCRPLNVGADVGTDLIDFGRRRMWSHLASYRPPCSSIRLARQTSCKTAR